MNNQLTNFTDQEILNEAKKRIEKDKILCLLKDLSIRIQDGEIKSDWHDLGAGTGVICDADGCTSLFYQDNDYLYSVDLKTASTYTATTISSILAIPAKASKSKKAPNPKNTLIEEV
ncbi:6603_t:CDS:2 [Entrophospora sp. SA101]|nr:6603_t:CDS:2 [Entrophospora sp. SA101]